MDKELMEKVTEYLSDVVVSLSAHASMMQYGEQMLALPSEFSFFTQRRMTKEK